MNIHKFPIILFQSLLMMTGTLSGQDKPGIFDNHTDIGNCRNKGSVIYDPGDQTYIISGSGVNMWFGTDEFHYLWTTLQGDFILRTEVKLLGEGVEPHRKVGWIIKNNLDNNSQHVNATTHGDGLTSLQYRKTVGGETEQILSTDSFPDVIQLERKGNTYIMSTARFGKEFTSVQLDSMPLDNEVYAGLYVCAHNPDIIEKAVFRNVRIIRPADSGFQPYKDYIGSHLEVMDVETGHRKILYSSAHSIQAPNWTADGKKLIYNSKGHLYTFDLATNIINPLNTGFAVNNNNDHVLTFDGRLLGISHHNQDDGGASSIYYLPVEGDSTPVAVTKPGAGASYLHGWSPDNKKMVFTGYRNNKYDIFTVDIRTGEEQQLTDQSSLDDGAEYSPDGKYIFFNSARTGKMKLWRMDADGENQIQLTFDEYNDWFPHVSPDQKWIVFISFPKEIDPGDHPFYKHCLLRIIPFAGGQPRIISYVYGGQGTMNVPSWSPDSKKISFVTNTKL
jgi:TolB protein